MMWVFHDVGVHDAGDSDEGGEEQMGLIWQLRQFLILGVKYGLYRTNVYMVRNGGVQQMNVIFPS